VDGFLVSFFAGGPWRVLAGSAEKVSDRLQAAAPERR